MTNNNQPQTTHHSPQTVLVTGAPGFIGSHLCERLVDEGHHVVALDNFNDFYDPEIKKGNISSLLDNPNFTLIPGDILNADLLEAIFSGDKGKIKDLSLDIGSLPTLEDPQTTNHPLPTSNHLPLATHQRR